jgi:hypothetical protein
METLNNKDRYDCIKIRKNGKLRKDELLLVWNLNKMSSSKLFEFYGFKRRVTRRFNYTLDYSSWYVILNDIGATLCLSKNWYNEWSPYAFLFDSMQHKMLYILKNPEIL